jgi:hypothetical protein
MDISFHLLSEDLATAHPATLVPIVTKDPIKVKGKRENPRIFVRIEDDILWDPDERDVLNNLSLHTF